MGFESIIAELSLIFAGSLVLATVFLYLRQPIILAYMALGMLIGPWGFRLVEDSEHIEQISHLGIILLLFLIGLHLQPMKLLELFRQTSLVTILSGAIFGILGLGISLAFGFPFFDSLLVGGTMMFSSTVVSLKLIPTTALHHKRIGALMTSVLLLQDIIAIIFLLLLQGGEEKNVVLGTCILALKLVGLSLFAFLIIRYVGVRLLKRFDFVHEFLFLCFLGWCLLLAEVAELLGLSYEMGAFVAGVSLAPYPIAMAVSEELKPLREFFLILFFFSLGARFDLSVTQQVFWPGLLLAGVMLGVKPLVFRYGFRWLKESKETAAELGARLGQGSEFALLVANGALLSGAILERTAYLVQMVVVVTFVVSTYYVVRCYATPIGGDKMRAD